MSHIVTIDYLQPYELGRRSLVQSLVPVTPGRAVDIGCGNGYYSAILFERGWRVTGIDAEQDNLYRASSHADNVLFGDAVHVLGDLKPHSFDLALCLEVIEHMIEGERLLERVHAVLRRGGRLILSTPNRFSPEGLYGYYWSEKIRKRGKWDAWHPTHQRIYSSFELLRCLRRAGFRPHRVFGYYYRMTLPFGVTFTPPFETAAWFPLNRLGFDTIIAATAD